MAFKGNSRSLQNRILLYSIIIFGLASMAFLLWVSEFHPSRADFLIYYSAADMASSGGDFIGSDADTIKAPYAYLPISVIVYLPFQIFPYYLAFGLMLLVNLVLLGLVTIEIVRIMDESERAPHFSDTDKWLVIGAIFLSAPTIVNLLQGQANFLILLLIMLGFVQLHHDRSIIAGSAFAIAALVKLWPAFLGIWMIRKRDWKAVSTAVGVGVGGFILSVIVFGFSTNLEYLRWVMGGGANTSGWTKANLHSLIINIGVTDSGIEAMIIAALMISPLLIVVYKWSDFENIEGEWLGFGATLLAVLSFVPAPRQYMMFGLIPLLPLIYKNNSGWRPRILLFISIVLTMLIVRPSNMVAAMRIFLPESAVLLVGELMVALFGPMLACGYGLLLGLFVLLEYGKSIPAIVN